jgi:hypothetical protein
MSLPSLSEPKSSNGNLRSERAASDTLNRATFDGIWNLYACIRLSRIQMHSKDEVAVLVLLDSYPTNARLLEQPGRMSALDCSNLFFRSHPDPQ